MASSDNGDEKKFKQYLQTLIDLISNANDQLQGKTNEKQVIDDLKKQLKSSLERSLSTLATPCRNYLRHLLDQYHYSEKEKTLSNGFTKDSVPAFLHDLQGRLASLKAFQAAWNGDQSIVEEFVKTYPKLKDQSGLYQTTLLYSAARNNHFHLVKYLIEQAYCSVNASNVEYLGRGEEPSNKATIGSTALHAACFQGHLDIVKYLIAHGGDYFQLNNAKESPVENGKSKSNVKRFFQDFIFISYSQPSTSLPKRSILQEIDENEERIIDCIWEYKPLTLDQWVTFDDHIVERLHEALTTKQIESEFPLKTSRREMTHLSLAKFLRFEDHDNMTNKAAWIRCRGSSLLNFHAYAHWQIMFTKHPSGTPMSSPSIEVFDKWTSGIQLSAWYFVDQQMNLLLETAMNYRRRYVNINLGEKLFVDLENFTLTNDSRTIEGCLRWIPKYILNRSDLKPVKNFQLSVGATMLLLTASNVRRAADAGQISSDEIKHYQLKYENVFENAGSDSFTKPSGGGGGGGNDPNRLVNVIQGDLLAEQTDVIVVCSLSKYLVESVFKAAGKSFKRAFDAQVKENEIAPVISVRSEGELASKAVYFVPWKPNSKPDVLVHSIEELVKNVVKKAASENYRSIAFPAIGCGEYNCDIDLIARTLVGKARELSNKYSISIFFVIQPDKNNIYDKFRNEIGPISEVPTESTVSLAVGKGVIEVQKGDITKQNVDVIIGSSSSEILRQLILKAAGDQIRSAYSKEDKANPNSLIIITPPGHLRCKKIFFLRWEPDRDDDALRQSIVDLISNVIQSTRSHGFTSMAFPAIGCGDYQCSINIVVKTMVREMKRNIEDRKLPWTVKFIIHPNQPDVYDEFSKQLLLTDHIGNTFKIPSTWQRGKDDQLRFIVPKGSDEYNSIIGKFDEAMKGQYADILKLERIQNETWYMQYMAHWKGFKKRLNQDTELRLYHGCQDTSTDPIIQDCFNRSYAGVNGTLYGFGVYFSKNATYSHGYAKPNASGERCMFVARVLVGKTTIGNSTMKTRPVGFDSTTDGNHMTVTYHDAQAYAEYLITYK